MPCNTIQKSKVAFLAASTDEGLLTKAMESLGIRAGQWRFNRSDGKLTLPSSIDVDAVRRAYSEQVVESQARKFGWQLQWSNNSTGNRQATVVRRSL